MIGDSRQMRDVIERLKRIAPTNASVLIQGETGTGKELVAQAIHQNSPRKNKPFVALNCAALSENILESELFGHVKGAFTDASTDRVGKFQYADGGTLFLDEVGDMPLATQIKLLRVLENGEITRVGSNEPSKVTCGSSRPPTATWRTPSSRARSAAICIIASKWSPSACPRCASGARISPSLSIISSSSSPAARQALPGHDGGGPAQAFDVRLAGQRAPVAQCGGEHGGGRLRRPVGRGRSARGTGGPAENEGEPADAIAGRPGGRPLEEIEKLYIAETCGCPAATASWPPTS